MIDGSNTVLGLIDSIDKSKYVKDVHYEKIKYEQNYYYYLKYFNYFTDYLVYINSSSKTLV